MPFATFPELRIAAAVGDEGPSRERARGAFRPHPVDYHVEVAARTAPAIRQDFDLARKLHRS
jgi:hypothetical protein